MLHHSLVPFNCGPNLLSNCSFLKVKCGLPLQNDAIFEPKKNTHTITKIAFHSDLACELPSTAQKTRESLTVASSRLLLERKSVTDISSSDLWNKLVFLRCDLDDLMEVGESGQETTQLFCSIVHTLHHLITSGARVIVAGQWKRKQAKEKSPLSMDQMADQLHCLLHKPVLCAPCCVGPTVETMASALSPGHLLLLPPLTAVAGESSNSAIFARQLSTGVNFFVNDSFSSSHRMTASTVAMAAFVGERVAGAAMAKELAVIRRVIHGSNNHCNLALVGRSMAESNPQLINALLKYFKKVLVVGKATNRLSLPATSPTGSHALAVLCEESEGEEGAGGRGKVVTLYEGGGRGGGKGGGNSTAAAAAAAGMVEPRLTSSSLPAYMADVESILWLSASASPPATLAATEAHLATAVAQALTRDTCQLLICGKQPMQLLHRHAGVVAASHVYVTRGATALLHLLQGKSLPGVCALDRKPCEALDWSTIFSDPSLPLTVDIGSGDSSTML